MKMKLIKKRILALPLALCLVHFGIACSGEDDPTVINEGQENGENANADTDAGANGDEEDVTTIGDVGDDNQADGSCASAAVDEWPLHDEVSGGAIDATEDGEITEFTIDASAGGFGNDSDNPFVYLHLGVAEKAELTDIEALESSEWDLAFRRTALRTNSADSGPGSVSVAKFANSSFDDVTQAPADSDRYATDESFGEDCEPRLDSIGGLYTAFNHLNVGNPSGSESWYDYGSGGGGGVSPTEGDIYVLEIDARDELYKMEILSWDSGEYSLRIAPIDSPLQ